MQHSRSKAFKPVSFTRVIVFFNPKSTHAATAKKRIDDIKQLLPKTPLEIIETAHGGPKANVQLVEQCADKLGPDTLLCIVAGDGTTNQIIQALLIGEGLSEKARRTPILPLWGGNANDLAYMLNGSSYRAKTADLLEKGKIVTIHPLECKLIGPKGTDTRIAACYAGFGASGFAARQLNAAAHRQSKLHALPGGRIIQELITIVSAIMEAPGFTVKESGSAKIVYERLFSNGPRMGKVARLPVQLTDEMFYLNTLENKRLLSAIPRIVESTRKKMSENFLGNFASFTVAENSWAQFDGETLEIPAGTKVQVQLSTRPFYALSTELHTPIPKEPETSTKEK
jgi:diacylglycerol kinase family enzyme